MSSWRINSLAHAQHSINLLDAEPMKDIRHKRLKPHIFDSGDILGSLEVIRRAIFATLPCVVYN